MLKFYDGNEWLETFKEEHWFSTFHHPAFLDIHAENYRVSPLFIAYFYKSEVIFAISTFAKGNTIITPDQFLRTGFFINKKFNDIQILNAQLELLSLLKKKYKKIEFHLPVEINDIRGFNWSGFKSILMHTYEKDLISKDYHDNIKRLINKKSPPFQFIIGHPNFKRILSLHERDFYKFGVRKKYVDGYLTLLEALKKSGYLIDLNLQFENQIVASNLVLLDKETKKAFVILISTSEDWYKYGVHAKLYDRCFEYLKAEGFEKVDLFGADISGFALFKLKFNVDLKHHYQVIYNSRKDRYQKAINRIKMLTKKYISFV